MTAPSFKIQHGELIDVTGRPARHEDVTFVPANVALTGTSFSFSHPLEAYAGTMAPGTKALVKPGDDAPWVLGRLMYLFGTTLVAEEFRAEKSCFHESFVAVLHARDNLSIPFSCTDYYCKSSLIFSSDDAPDAALQDEIAEQFWSFLLSAPTEINDYESRMFHPGACIWIRFGVEGGEPYMIETDD